jgi:O-antigen/teichoic acid export membrane protein
MGVVIRQSFKGSVFMYFGVLVGLINRLFLLPHYLTLEQLGLIDAITIISVVFSELSLFGIKGSLQKFFSIFEDKGILRNYMGLVILVPIIGYVFLGLSLFLFQDWVIDLFPKDKEMIKRYYYFIYPIGFFLMYKGILTIFSANKMRLTVPAIINDFFLKLSVLMLLLLIGFSFIDFDWYVILFSGSYVIATVGLYLYCKKVLRFGVSFNIKEVIASHGKEIRRYSFFILLMGVSNMVSQFTDSLMLASIKGLETSAIYSVAFFIGLSIEMPKRAISNISGAIIARHWNDNNKIEIVKLYKQSSINQGVIGVGLFLLVLFSLDEIFYILPKSEILIQGKSVAIIIGVSRIIDMITGINSEILRTSSKYRYDFYLLIFFIGLSITTNYFLIPVYGIEGAAYATLISVSLYNILRYFVLKLTFKFDPFDRKTGLLVLIFLVLVGIIYLVPNFSYDSVITAIIIIAIKSVVIGSVFAFVTYKLKLSNEINKLIDWGINKLKRS